MPTRFGRSGFPRQFRVQPTTGSREGRTDSIAPERAADGLLKRQRQQNVVLTGHLVKAYNERRRSDGAGLSELLATGFLDRQFRAAESTAILPNGRGAWSAYQERAAGERKEWLPFDGFSWRAFLQ